MELAAPPHQLLCLLSADWPERGHRRPSDQGGRSRQRWSGLLQPVRMTTWSLWPSPPSATTTPARRAHYQHAHAGLPYMYIS